MKIKKENIFGSEQKYDAICVTTNGIVRNNGRLVMGAGVAKAFKEKYPGLDLELGKKVSQYGNVPFVIYRQGTAIVSFPTKHNWRHKSDIGLIMNSAKTLVKITSGRFWTSVALTPPGCGNGGLDWKTQVEPALKGILDDRFTIHFL